MKFFQRYKRLSLWNKIAFWGTIATFIGLLLTIGTCSFQNNIVIDEETLKFLIDADVPQEKYKELLYELEKERNKKIDKEAQKELAQIVARFYSTIEPSSKISFNKEIKNPVTGDRYRLDLAIEDDLGGHSVLIAVKLLYEESEVEKIDLISFKNILSYFSASKAVIISRGDFNENAKAYANRNLIDLCKFKDAKSRDWKDDLRIPVVLLQKIPNVNFNIGLTLVAGDYFQKDLLDWDITLDNRKTTSKIREVLTTQWDNSNLPATGQQELRFENKKVEVRTKNGFWRHLKDFAILINFDEKRSFAYLTPENFFEIENLSSHKIYTNYNLNIPAFTNEKSWKPFEEIDELRIQAEYIEIIYTPNIEVENMFAKKLVMEDPSGDRIIKDGGIQSLFEEKE